jgi:hypothetical protein
MIPQERNFCSAISPAMVKLTLKIIEREEEIWITR